MIEGGSPNTLFRRGFTKDSLAAGTEMVVDGYRAKDGSNREQAGYHVPGRQEAVPGIVESGRAL